MSIEKEIATSLGFFIADYMDNCTVLPICHTPNIDPLYLQWMCDQILDMDDPGKQNRWIGYIQGCLVSLQISTVEAERTRVRNIILNNT